MELTFLQKLIKPALILLFTIFSLHSFSQKTFTVVCDKTDKLVKVVESHDRSPNYVPIKGGFPFRQVAQKWIDENYSTTNCNPEEIIKQIKAEENSNSQLGVTNQKNKPSEPVSAAAPLQPRASYIQTPQYRNTSFNINGKFSDIGKIFSLDKNMSPGFDIGFEQLFGKNKYYLGIGVGMNFYFADFSADPNFDQVTFFFGKIPLFFGYRTHHKKYLFMSEVGAEFNTELQASDDDFTFYGKTPNSNSYDIMARIRFGTDKIMLSLGTELWVSEIFENNDYRMTVVYAGLKFSF